MYNATNFQILDKEAVEEVRTQREIPDIRPGYLIQLRLVRKVYWFCGYYCM